MPASGATPTGPGTTSNQWWITQWHYFVMPDSVKEMLRSDGTTFTVIGDSNILAGVLTNADGSPRYPILISLASEAIDDGEIANLTNYVAAGGFLFIGSSAFTRNTNGTTRGDFAIANAMGIHMVTPGLTNWGYDLTQTKLVNHRLVAHLPGGTVFWEMPSSADEITVPQSDALTGETPDETPPAVLPYMTWQVQASNSVEIAQGDLYPNLLVTQFGKGYFIYYSPLEPLIGHGGWAPSTYAYTIFRNAIEWAFQVDNLPVVKVSPWPYPYWAAAMFRHDLEAIPSLINCVESSAQFEYTNGAKGEYYFCTGALREDYSHTAQTNEIASLQRAMTLYGAVIGSHNGGLTNINKYVPPLDIVEQVFSSDPNWYTSVDPYAYDTSYFMLTDYSYWHWGPDEILDDTNLPLGYASVDQYALASISNSLSDLTGWGLTNSTNPLTWVAPNFNATRERSYEIEQQLGVKATGEEKLSPFPSWVLSTGTADKRYPFITLPPSDWFIGSEIGQSMEAGQTPTTVSNVVDYFYNLGALINLYGHSSAAGNAGAAGPEYSDYVLYSMNPSIHPRLWAANSQLICQWWLQRSNAQITAATVTINGSQSQVAISISGATTTNAAVEVLLPSASYDVNQITTNGVPANNTNLYWTNGQTLKLLVGTSVTNATISYTIYPSVQNSFYSTSEGTLLSVVAPGVLTNATGGSGPLTALLANGPADGSLTLNSDGSFNYTPSNNFAGIDSFNFQATDGSLTSSVANATIDVTPPGDLFYDNFTRPLNSSNSLSPWILQDGTWTLTNNTLQGIGNGLPNYYGTVYISTNWTDYSVQAQLQFLSTNMWAGGVGGRLNPTTGAHYTAWVFPEGSQGPNYPPTFGSTGIPVLKLMKFQAWQANNSQFSVMQQVNLPAVGTNVHTVTLTFQGTNINVYFDGALKISTNDATPFTSGGITLDAASYPNTTTTMSVDSVTVTTLPLVANNDNYSVAQNTTLTVGAPGVLANDIGTGLAAVPVSGPAHGTLTLYINGSFSYTPTNNFFGIDSFTYQASNGQTNSNIATVSITVNQNLSNPVMATNDYYSVVSNMTLAVSAPGVLANDGGGSGPLTALLANGPSDGSLTLNSDGSFSYTPSNNFVGLDNFTYQATDGSLTSSVATATIDVTPTGGLFYDNFTRSLTSSNSLYPWILEDGVWTITNNTLQGIGNAPPGYYGNVYINANWTDYSVQAQMQFLSTNMWAGGVGGRLNSNTGAHYAAWVFPEGSYGPNWPTTYGPTGIPVLKLMKFQVWQAGTGQYSVMQQVSLPAVGTNVHTVTLALQGTNVSVYFDGTLEINTNDATPFTSGGITLDAASYPDTTTTMSVKNVTVSSFLLGQTITFGPLPNKTYGDSPFTVGATASSGLPVSFSILSGPATISSNTITITGIGTVTVQASQAGNSNYQAAPNVNQSFVVSNKTLTITSGITANGKVYDGTTIAVLSSNAVVLAGVLAGDTNNVSLSTNGYVANFTSAGVSNGIPVIVSGLTLSGSAAVNYTLSQPTNLAANITSKTLTIGSALPPPVITSINLTNGVVTIMWNSVTGGIYRVQYNNSLNGGGWTDLSPDVTATGLTATQTNAVGSAPQRFYRVKLLNSGLSANDKMYDGTMVATLSSNDVVLVGVINGDSVSLATNGYIANFATANVGTNIAVTVSGLGLSGSAAENYTLSQPTNLVANITGRGVTISSGLSANGKVYDGTAVATLSSNGVVLVGVINGDSVSLVTNGYTANFASANVGTNIAVTVSSLGLSGSAAGNYTLSQPTNLTANITGQVLTILVVPPPVITSIVVTNSIATITWASVTNGIYRVQYLNNLGNGSWSNLVPDVNATGLIATQTDIVSNVQQRFYRILVPYPSFTANNKVYDGTTIATISSNNVVLNGVLAGDVGNVGVTTNGYVANFVSANVGTGIPVLLNGLTLTGPAAGNYTLSQPTNLMANITGKGVTITSGLSANAKVYDGTTVATLTSNSVVLAGVLAGDTNNVSLSTNGYAANFASANVSNNVPVVVSGLGLAGSAAGNYSLIQPTNLTANITGKGVTISSGLSANKVYDGTTVATLSSNSVVLAGVVAADTNNVSVSTNGYAANFASANVSNGVPVTVTGLSLMGNAAGNYTLSQPVMLLANIAPATLTVSANSQSVTYGLPIPPLTINYSGFAGSEGTNVLTGAPSISTTATNNSPPANYPITVSAGTLSATNYTFVFVNGTLAVVALPQLSVASLNSSQVAFAWPTVLGESYQLEYTTNLVGVVWIPIGGPIVGTGSLMGVTNALGASPQSFFRLVISY